MKDNLKQKIEQIIHIHLDSKYYYRDYKYLCQPDTKEEREVINNSFINRIWTMFWKMAVIELNKHQYNEDYHPDGGENFRGRHAWLGFDSQECVEWIMKILNDQ